MQVTRVVEAVNLQSPNSESTPEEALGGALAALAIATQRGPLASRSGNLPFPPFA